MSKIFEPTNPIRFKKLAVVRLKKGGQCFEIACYKHKVLPWKFEQEKDIDEVLQTHTVFTNVSKGKVAKKEDLVKVFRKDNQTDICKEILKKGEQQLSEKESQSQINSLFKEIAMTVADKCVNPNTKRPYPVSYIENMMKSVHYSVNINKSAKQQALDVIPLIKAEVPLERVQMRVWIHLTGQDAQKTRNEVVKLITNIEEENLNNGIIIITCWIDPRLFQSLEELIITEAKDEAKFELLELKIVEGTQDL